MTTETELNKKSGKLIVIISPDVYCRDIQIANLSQYLNKDYCCRKFLNEQYLAAEKSGEIAGALSCGIMIITPHLSGEILLALKNKDINWNEIKKIIKEKSGPKPDIVIYIKNNKTDSLPYEKIAKKNIGLEWVVIDGDQKIIDISYDIINVVIEKLNLK
ncbi:MAG: hypothetical protein WC303_02240 [Candidatus Paceibacterota bacterium]|jgi:hypothetical protein